MQESSWSFARNRPLFDEEGGMSLLAEWNKYTANATSVVTSLGDNLKAVATDVSGNVSEGTGTALTGLNGLNTTLSSGLNNTLSNLKTATTSSVAGIGSYIEEGNKTITTGLSTGLSRSLSGFESASNNLVTGVQQGANRIATDATSLASNVQQGATAGATAMATGVSTGAVAVQSGALAGVNTIKSGVQDGVNSLQTLSTKRLMYFGLLVFMGGFFMVLAIFVGLPVVILAPAKFAICFTMSSLCNMGAVTAIRGPQQQLNHLVAPERLPFSACYLTSMLGTLWAAMIYHSYMLSIIFSAVQVCALAYYMATFFPGGTSGLKMISQILFRTLKPFFVAFGKCLGMTCSAGSSMLLPR
ncbi:hypothetical protein CYMTET_39949 [Cymbomonas tetramitiformis]|uniref:Vesicle transport protein n=1 Tax=Cymbomonas tetramitiformis TaxID=36881 RepID=A0AAE0C944_9CHLO|nr:hypothetical protein CYMTET_39949 [Cymbomonas tetramitiformis]